MTHSSTFHTVNLIVYRTINPASCIPAKILNTAEHHRIPLNNTTQQTANQPNKRQTKMAVGVHVEPDGFLHLGRNILRTHKKIAAETERRRFHATFGTGPEMCTLIWGLLRAHDLLPSGGLPSHLLWGLMFLKLYCSESVHCAMAGGVDEKTFRKWAWIFVDAISYLEEHIVSITKYVIASRQHMPLC